ncbi:amidohydrolase [Vibrio sp. SCSIO 43136]|uniref:amidohydrolase n=1 Tax=Vibrio sp. SCSIO 43136 TaxID=2819101 RepID=UPI002074F098|nr:amidohydrolase [Vibrio sp. SCSIO 43136]USD67773.1 amidohydrolase [Vibrio sp. SCSIO 43136]
MKKLLVASMLVSAMSYASVTADWVYTNADIYTHKNADSIAIAEGKIIKIGTMDQIGPYLSQYTQEVDLNGAFILPGFIDNHNHVFEAASGIGGDCELGLEEGLEEQIEYLQACRSEVDLDQWVIGYGFSLEPILRGESERTPLEVIDAVFPDQPVIFMEQTSHSMWVNSVALTKAGIDQHTLDPKGGRILKDPQSGKLLGILLDNAGDQVMELAWNSKQDLFNQNYAGLMAGLEEAAKYGITTIGDGRMYWKRGWFDVWRAADKNGDLTARVSLRPWIYPSEPMSTQLTYLREFYTPVTDDALLVVDQVKMYSDGILINGTSKLLRPYVNTYLLNDPLGINYISPDAMKLWLQALDEIGYGAHIHAIGDGAIRESLNAIEVMRAQKSTQRYTLTHVELVNSKDVPRFAKLDVTADFQVGSDYVAYHDHQWAEAFLGAKRARALMNLNAIAQTEANVTLSSDWNVHHLNPLVGIGNSLIMGNTGLPNVDAAIDAYTINAARSLGLERQTGSLKVGKWADFVVLDRNITVLPPEKIATSQVLLTVLQGDVVYRANE